MHTIQHSNDHTIQALGKLSEDTDWDVIYHTFHNPKDIAERIAFELNDHEAEIIFCGFPETAAYLATVAKLQFVDQSSVVTQRTKERYPDIQRIIEGNISNVLTHSPTKNVVIACRLSAFWQTQKAFDELASAILSHPRDQILIDFFDRDAVYEGMHIFYQANVEENDKEEEGHVLQTGDWDFKRFDETPNSNPPMHIASIDISYVLSTIIDNGLNNAAVKNPNSDNITDNATDNIIANTINFTDEIQQAFFTKMGILNWCSKAFPKYETTLVASLLEDDPSFLVKLTAT